jgi:choline dehydrogenase
VVAGLRIAREIGAAPALARGACAIGTDERSVVDTSLHVHRISNLRVADASVMPSPISANTNATVYAIAERAAELIRS